MAKQIIVLDRQNIPSDLTFRYVLWASVPSARQSYYANALATSAYKDASGTEITALQNGSIVERMETAFFPVGTPLATMQGTLQAKFTEFQSHVNQNQFVRYGTFFDGTSWTVQGVA